MMEDGGWKMEDVGLRCCATLLYKIKSFALQSFQKLLIPHSSFLIFSSGAPA